MLQIYSINAFALQINMDLKKCKDFFFSGCSARIWWCYTHSPQVYYFGHFNCEFS